MSYDNNNIFAKILRHEVPNNTVYEDDHVLAFHDINPASSVHVLVIPKGSYVDADDFSTNASAKEIAGFWQGVTAAVRSVGLMDDGYRLIVNTGANGGQEVPHYHVHILGGAPLGSMLKR